MHPIILLSSLLGLEFRSGVGAHACILSDIDLPSVSFAMFFSVIRGPKGHKGTDTAGWVVIGKLLVMYSGKTQKWNGGAA